MLKPLQGDTMFVPNYEDYDRPATNYGAAVYPQLWPEEMAGEGAIYRWHQFLNLQHHTMSPSELVAYFQRMLTPDEETAYWNMFVRALVSLARECGWKVKNEFLVKELDAHPFFVTDRPIANNEPPPPPRDNGINIDMQALANHMGDMMPPSFRVRNESKHWRKPESRMELQELVCSMLAKDNGWQEVQPKNMYNKTFYKI